MPNTKYVLEKIKIESALHDILAASTGELVKVTYKGSETTLASALASIIADVAALPTSATVDSKISTAIGELIAEAPETGDTLKELFDLISSNSDAMSTLNSAIGSKAEKSALEALQTTVNTLSGGNHNHANKAALDGITSEKISAWDNKAEKTEATVSNAGLMSAADKSRLNGLRGVRYGTEVPADMQSGELFVHIMNS